MHSKMMTALLMLALAAPVGAMNQGRGRGGGSSTPKPPVQTPASSKPRPAPPAKGTPPPRPFAVQPALATKLTPLLPPGQTVETAALGFKNTGQFVAAVHVANNLNIPFDALKARMTGPEPLSLGQAITALKPGADASREVRRAEAQALEDIRASGKR
jgi:hypothetical protein